MKTIDRLITIGSLLKRWPGMRDEDIVSHMRPTPFDDDSILNGYLHIKTLRGQDGKPIHYCEATPVFPRSWMNGNGVSFDWSGGSEISLGIVFDLDDVERMESLHPEFRNAIILPDEILQIVEPTQSGAGYWINCDTLADRWKCSPFDVVEAIDEKGLNLDAAYGNPLFRHDTLDNFSVHSVDLAKFEHEHAEYLESFKPPQEPSHANIDTLSNLFSDQKERAEAEKLLAQADAIRDVEQLQKIIDELTAENLRLQSEIESKMNERNQGPCPLCEATRKEAERIKDDASRSRWLPSCEAACKTLAMAVADKERITKDQFLDRLSINYKGNNGVLTEAENVAWRNFPAYLKHSNGEKK